MVYLEQIVTKDLIEKFRSNQFSFIMVYDGSPDSKLSNPNISTVIKLKEFAFKYLKIKQKQNIRVKDVILPKIPISPKSARSVLSER